MTNPHSSNSVMESFLAASGNLLLAYLISLGVPFCIWYSVLPVANLLVSEYNEIYQLCLACIKLRVLLTCV